MKNRLTFFTIFLLLVFLLIGCDRINPFHNDDNSNNNSQLQTFDLEIGSIGYLINDVFQGQHVEVPITVTTDRIISGFDILIEYNSSILSFQNATQGQSLIDNGWEYFTYRYGLNANCTQNCPSALIRLISIADTNNGSNHPTKNKVSELVVLDFLVSNDSSFQCSSVPIQFFWGDCEDNNLVDWDQEVLFISNKVYNRTIESNVYFLDTIDTEIQTDTVGYPTSSGAQYSTCDTSLDLPNNKNINFYNGSVFIACKDLIDKRGDINLNSISNEIADAVLFASYFLNGLSVFTVNTDGQIEATDVNADRITLTVADLVYLIRIIVGDALPYYKLTPVYATLTSVNNILTIDKPMGAVHIVFAGDVNPTLLAGDMKMEYQFDGVNTQVLIYSFEGNSFTGNFLQSIGNIISIEFGSALGGPVILTK